MSLQPRVEISSNREEQFRRQLLYLMVSLMAAAVGPFAAYRFIQGEWLLGLWDLLLIAGIALLAFLNRRGFPMLPLALTVSVLYFIGLVGSIILQGPAGVLWLFPATVVNYFLHDRRWALAINLTCCLIVPVLVFDDLPMSINATLLATLFLVNGLSYGFATRVMHAHRDLQRLATLDHLTGVGNRREMERFANELMAQSQRHGEAASLIVFDFDHFKRINDEFGHSTGDQLLIDLTQCVEERLRQGDRLFRFGGEEFAILLPRSAIGEACQIAERLRAALAELESEEYGVVTASFGVAEYKRGGNFDAWMKRADDAVYEAKRQGRNRVWPCDSGKTVDASERAEQPQQPIS